MYKARKMITANQHKFAKPILLYMVPKCIVTYMYKYVAVVITLKLGQLALSYYALVKRNSQYANMSKPRW